MNAYVNVKLIVIDEVIISVYVIQDLRNMAVHVSQFVVVMSLEMLLQENVYHVNQDMRNMKVHVSKFVVIMRQEMLLQEHVYVLEILMNTSVKIV